MEVGVNAKTTPIFPRARNRYPFYRRVCGPEGRSVTMRKSPPPGFDLWTVQHVASPYTDWAILDHLQMSTHLQMRFLLLYVSFNLRYFLFVYDREKSVVLLTILYITHGVEAKIFFLVFSNIHQSKSVPNYVVLLNVTYLHQDFQWTAFSGPLNINDSTV
jgi:hypothetical protein